MKLPKAQVEKMMKECSNEAEVAQKILELCVASNDGGDDSGEIAAKKSDNGGGVLQKQMLWKNGHGHGGVQEGFKAREVSIFCDKILILCHTMCLQISNSTKDLF